MTIYWPQCHYCKHRHQDRRVAGPTPWACDAFPLGIPGAIMNNTYDHRVPHPSDHGIRFEEIPGSHGEDILRLWWGEVARDGEE